MVLSLRGHVIIGTSTINMQYSFVDNIDCMSHYKLREWKAAFGVRPVVCYEAWAIIAKRASVEKLSPKHFYWALYFMRTYQVETDIARNLGTDSKTLRGKVKQVIHLLSSSMSKVIHWQKRNCGSHPGEKFKITVDGTHFLIEEVYNCDGTVNQGYWSHKFNGAGLAYEIALAIYSDNIVWVNGPYRAGMSDLKIFKEKGLVKLLSIAKERAVADGTYNHWAASQRGHGSHDWKSAKNRFRARQETVNRRLKIFRCLQDRWRHDHELHGEVVRAICFLTQLSFQQNPLMDAVV